MPVVGTIAGPIGSPLVNMGGGDGEGNRSCIKVRKIQPCTIKLKLIGFNRDQIGLKSYTRCFQNFESR